jgi:hypothetical protein
MAKWITALSTAFLLSACGSGQSDVKSSAKPDSTSSVSSPADATNPVGKTDAAPTGKTGSGANEVGGDEGYRLTRFEIARPPFAYTLKTAINVPATPAPTLAKVSEKKNKVTDTPEWFEKNGLSLAGRKPRNGPERPKAPSPSLDTSGSDKLHYLLDHGDHSILLYGANFIATTELLWLDKGQIARGQFDFSAWVKAPESVPGEEQFTNAEVVWAQIVEDILYVSTMHHSFAKSSKGKNAFVSAIGAKDGELRWQSEPLVCNTENFVIHGAYIICGYGFSDESDFLYVISRADGKTVSKTPLKSGARYIVMKNNQLFVRARDVDYVFDVK